MPGCRGKREGSETEEGGGRSKYFFHTYNRQGGLLCFGVGG